MLYYGDLLERRPSQKPLLLAGPARPLTDNWHAPFANYHVILASAANDGKAAKDKNLCNKNQLLLWFRFLRVISSENER